MNSGQFFTFTFDDSDTEPTSSRIVRGARWLEPEVLLLIETFKKYLPDIEDARSMTARREKFTELTEAFNAENVAQGRPTRSLVQVKTKWKGLTQIYKKESKERSRSGPTRQISGVVYDKLHEILKDRPTTLEPIASRIFARRFPELASRFSALSSVPRAPTDTAPPPPPASHDFPVSVPSAHHPSSDSLYASSNDDMPSVSDPPSSYAHRSRRPFTNDPQTRRTRRRTENYDAMTDWEDWADPYDAFHYDAHMADDIQMRYEASVMRVFNHVYARHREARDRERERFMRIFHRYSNQQDSIMQALSKTQETLSQLTELISQRRQNNNQ